MQFVPNRRLYGPLKWMGLIGIALVSVILLGCAAAAQAQDSPKLTPLAKNAPADRPEKLADEKKFDAAIKPSVEQALKTYPAAKERYLAGLPTRNVFFITTRLHDSNGRWEQVFIEVKAISEGKVKGLIANDINTVSGYRLGDSYTFPESELLDWTISKPDGTEEGNFVGKFLDTHKP
jgi:uncharacterized protein YegJ (DUF2314 family)